MDTAETTSLHLRWTLSWMRDLLRLADDLVGWGDADQLCLHTDLRGVVREAISVVVGLPVEAGLSSSEAARYIRHDPGFPGRFGPPWHHPWRPATLRNEVEEMLRRFDLAMDDRHARWPGHWRALRRNIDRICGWPFH